MRKMLITLYYIALLGMGVSALIGFLHLLLVVTIAYVGAILIFVSDPGIRKKRFLLLGILLIASSVLVHWPFGYLMPMEGHVRDKKTGASVANAIMEIGWSYGEVSVGGAVWNRFGTTYAVSDEYGKYRVNGRIVFPFPFSSYGIRQTVSVFHPLYDMGDSDGAESLVVFDEVRRGRTRYLLPRLGRIDRDISLIRLVDKYWKVDNINKSVVAAGDLADAMKYRDLAMRLNVVDRVVWQEIFDEWRSFVARWPKTHIKNNAMKRIDKEQGQLARAGIYGEGK